MVPFWKKNEFSIKDYEVFEPVGGKQGKMEIQLDTSSLSRLYSSKALPHRIFYFSVPVHSGMC